MIKMQMIKKQLETFFKDNGYKYFCINKKVKIKSAQMYLLRLNIISDETKEIENEINVIITVFSSAPFIFIETFNIYEVSSDESILNIYKLINDLNSYAFPGKFLLDKDNVISYRCVIDYSKLNTIQNNVLEDLIDSVPLACSIFLEEIEKEKNTNE
jgi:hypothetical protein